MDSQGRIIEEWIVKGGFSRMYSQRMDPRECILKNWILKTIIHNCRQPASGEGPGVPGHAGLGPSRRPAAGRPAAIENPSLRIHPLRIQDQHEILRSPGYP